MLFSSPIDFENSMGEENSIQIRPKARFKLCCMRLRIRASFGEATWLHPFPPAMKRRQIHASLGEATRLPACSPAMEATNSALALERLHTTLRWLFWESFGEASEFPVLRILPKFFEQPR